MILIPDYYSRWESLEFQAKLLVELRGSLFRKDLAKDCGIHQNTLGKYERAEVAIPLCSFVSVMDTLGYEVHVVKRKKANES